VEEQASVTVSGFDRLLSGNRYQLQAKQHSPCLIKRPLSRLPVSPIIIERLRLLSVPKSGEASLKVMRCGKFIQ
jgi:hypothetical protein